VTSTMKRPSAQHYGIAAFLITLAVVALSGLGPRLPSTERLLPHGVCYLWDPALMRLHIVSDTLIALAYIGIPVSLVTFIRRRKDLPFNWMFLLFGLFIVACGATHLMGLWTLWNPDYWLEGGVKAITAAASVPTAILLFLLVPKAVALPSSQQLREAKERLEAEVLERGRVEAELREAHALLEGRVQERTAELQKVNDLLQVQTAQLQESDRQKDEFLAILSHELRNPVHAIRMGSGYLVAVSKDPEVQETAASMGRQVAHVSRLLDDLMGVLRKNREGFVLSLQPTDIVTVVKSSVETARAFFEQRQQTLEVHLPDASVTARADAGRLAQAITNLLTNASSYSPPAATIVLDVKLENDQIRLAVQDPGIGFDTAEGERLFELFSRGERAKAQSATGLGIGLHLSRAIVAAHGGRLEASSAGRDKGSEFLILLPIGT
jgi:signal transduction histidine kinase